MPDSEPARAPSAGLVEPVAAFAGATALASAAYWIGQHVPVVGSNLHGIIAILFLYAPAIAGRLSGRGFDYRAAGLRADPVRLGLATAGVGVLLFFPIFFAAFLIFYGTTCGPDVRGLWAWWADIFAPACAHWHGVAAASFRLPPNFILLCLSQFVAVALPEELFFRGYLLQRLEERWPSRRKLWGAPVGKALLVSSVAFGVGHVLVDFDPQRLVVFFPALAFGWMRARTGSLLAGALFHALCNLFSDVVYASFFR